MMSALASLASTGLRVATLSLAHYGLALGLALGDAPRLRACLGRTRALGDTLVPW